MGLTNDERSSLAELRLEKAKRFIAEAEQMLSMGLWDLAANRFYYKTIMCNITFTQKSYFCGSGEIVRG